MVEQRELWRISSLLIFVINREQTLLLRTRIDRINTSVYIVPLNRRRIKIALIIWNRFVGGLVKYRTSFWVVSIMVFLGRSIMFPHLCVIFLALNLGFRLPVSNPFSFILVWFILENRQSLIMQLKLATIRFVREAEVLLNNYGTIFILILVTGSLGSLGYSSITP